MFAQAHSDNAHLGASECATVGDPAARNNNLSAG